VHNNESDILDQSPAYPDLPRVRLVLGTLLLSILGGSVLGILIFQLISTLLGWDYSLLAGAAGLPGMHDAFGRFQTRLFLGLNHFCTFLLPSALTVWLFYRYKGNQGLSWLKADKWPTSAQTVMGILVMLLSIPVVFFSYQINKMVPLPDLLKNMEADTVEILKQLLVMDTPWELLTNLVVVALLPGIGEELLFRGVVQQQLQRRLQQPWMAILLTAIIFSAIHLQFEGFLPRMLLGVLLGWMYWRTGNFWVPAIAHFFNNALQVVVQYLYRNKISTVDLEKDVEVHWGIALISSILLLYIVTKWGKKQSSDILIN
jgi:uncharacterized protein